MQGCTLEWRTKFQREATTRDSKRGQSGNTVIWDPRILCTPFSEFLDPPLPIRQDYHTHIVKKNCAFKRSPIEHLMNDHWRQHLFLWYLSPVKRICVFEHSVITNFNCACPAIQRGQGSGFLSEGASWLTCNFCFPLQYLFDRSI